MADKPQLYLHIGHPKSASSTLQSFLFENSPALKQTGYALPTADLLVSNAATMAGNPLWALQKIRETNDPSPLINWIQEEQAQPSFAGKLILSSESLAQPEWPVLFAHIADIVDINLIYYIRRQDQLLLSAWRQWGLKRGLTLDDFIKRRIENKQPDFFAIAQAWTNTLTIKHCHVRFIEPNFLEGQSVVEDFKACLGITNLTHKPIENQNISIDARLLIFMSNHPHLFSSVHDEEVFDLLRDSSQHEPDIRLALNQKQFDNIKGTFEPLNQIILKHYQPSHSGIPVIDSKTANLIDDDTAICEKEQVQYIKERLKATDMTNPKLLQVKKILE